MTRKSGLAFVPHLPSPPYPTTAYARVVSSKPPWTDTTIKFDMRISVFVFLLLTTLSCSGQNYKPSIVVLSPYETIYDSTLLTEIETYFFEGYSTPEDEKKFQEELKDKPENIAIMKFAEWNFRETKDFASMQTMSFYGMISYRIHGMTDKLLVFPSRNRSSGQESELRLIAKRHEVRWVINPVSLHCYSKNGQKLTTVKLQIFDGQKGKVILSKDYTGDSKNPGLEFTCNDGSLACTTNNILRQSLDEILVLIMRD